MAARQAQPPATIANQSREGRPAAEKYGTPRSFPVWEAFSRASLPCSQIRRVRPRISPAGTVRGDKIADNIVKLGLLQRLAVAQRDKLRDGVAVGRDVLVPQSAALYPIRNIACPVQSVTPGDQLIHTLSPIPSDSPAQAVQVWLKRRRAAGLQSRPTAVSPGAAERIRAGFPFISINLSLPYFPISVNEVPISCVILTKFLSPSPRRGTATRRAAGCLSAALCLCAASLHVGLGRAHPLRTHRGTRAAGNGLAAARAARA